MSEYWKTIIHKEVEMFLEMGVVEDFPEFRAGDHVYSFSVDGNKLTIERKVWQKSKTEK